VWQLVLAKVQDRSMVLALAWQVVLIQTLQLDQVLGSGSAIGSGLASTAGSGSGTANKSGRHSTTGSGSGSGSDSTTAGSGFELHRHPKRVVVGTCATVVVVACYSKHRSTCHTMYVLGFLDYLETADCSMHTRL
jgi:hypothetical protein